MTTLSYNLISAYDAGVDCHPSEDLERLGITYTNWRAQTTADCIWIDVETVPDNLPEYITVIHPYTPPACDPTQQLRLDIWRTTNELMHSIEVANVWPPDTVYNEGLDMYRIAPTPSGRVKIGHIEVKYIQPADPVHNNPALQLTFIPCN
jgi:hypothetical protein